MNKKLQVLKYLLSDFFAAGLAWGLFFVFRKIYVEHAPLALDFKFYMGIIIIPLFWIALYLLTGTYKNIYRKSRLRELGQTLFIIFFGVLVIFFVLLLDDEVASYKQYYKTFFALFSLQFFFTYIPRLILSSITAYKIHNRIIGFNTLLVGSNQKALEVYREIESTERSAGNKFAGFIHINGNNGNLLNDCLPHLGSSDNIKNIIKENNIEEVIIAIESSEHKSIKKIITELEDTEIITKITPDMYDILSGSVKMTSIYGTPLKEISHDIMPVWQQSVKRIIDIVISLIVLIAGSPFFLITSIFVKLSSKGPTLYTHERIGIHGKPFTIYKFRSMHVNAENNGPALSSKNDKRITHFGKFMRRVRLDEIPQFYNVLIGDMAIVGPRPERQYFIDRIVEKAPHYSHLHKVKPGITSWGQVKYGYAENIEQMIQRLKYDIIYIENLSLAVDLKIIIYTVLTVIRGRGR
ncbi:MAG: sugar transferase [Bacteroidota bacterium]